MRIAFHPGDLLRRIFRYTGRNNDGYPEPGPVLSADDGVRTRCASQGYKFLETEGGGNGDWPVVER